MTLMSLVGFCVWLDTGVTGGNIISSLDITWLHVVTLQSVCVCAHNPTIFSLFKVTEPVNFFKDSSAFYSLWPWGSIVAGWPKCLPSSERPWPHRDPSCTWTRWKLSSAFTSRTWLAWCRCLKRLQGDQPNQVTGRKSWLLLHCWDSCLWACLNKEEKVAHHSCLCFFFSLWVNPVGIRSNVRKLMTH